MPSYRPYRTFSPASAPAPKRPRRRLAAKNILWISLAIFMMATILRVDLAERASARAAVAAELAKRRAAVAALAPRIEEIVSLAPQVDFSVAISDSNTNLKSDLNDTVPQDAASTAKLLSASLFLKDVELGRQSLGDTVDGVSAKAALRLMVQQSDDNAWAAFNDLLGHNALQDYAGALGLTTYDSASNSISAGDMNKLIADLYQGRLLNAADTDMLMSFMQNTNYEDLISPAVTAPSVIYHKVGLDGDEVNDAAIIKAPGDTLFITIYTNGNGTYDWSSRAHLMQQIALAAQRAYFNN